MLNKTEQEIISLLLKAPYEPYTVYGIAKNLKRYVSQVQTAVEHLKKMKILNVKKLGIKTSACTVNFSTADIDALSYASLSAKRLFLKKNLKIRIIMDEMEKKLAKYLYIMLLFGSHAKENAKKDSDIDLCFIVQNEEDATRLKPKINAILNNLSYRIHINVFAAEWFYDMLKEKGTVGREILKSSLVLHGHDMYYNLVKEYDKKN